MASIELKVFESRAREIRRAIRRSSPALVYSGPLGVVVIAQLRNGTPWRIGKVMDRMAIVSRGDTISGSLVHKVAADAAYTVATSFSRGGVLGREPAEAVGMVLRERNHRFTLATPLPVEACFVQLNAMPQDDYLAHISVNGEMHTFRTVWFLGEAAVKTTSQSKRDEALDELNTRLAGAIGDSYERPADLLAALAQPSIPEPVRALAASTNLDIVVLDRAKFTAHDYGHIFNRLTS